MHIKLIAGLGNPGAAYAKTRHNAGAWLLTAFAEQMGKPLSAEKKFYGSTASIKLNEDTCYLLIPSTFMNHSGQAIKAISSFYKISPRAILVVHDEIDLPVGSIKLKSGGGHGGHNGLRDIINQLGDRTFQRLRIGVGHPGHRDRVHDYVLNAPSLSERQRIEASIERALVVLPLLLQGDMQKAMQQLHTIDENNEHGF